MQINHTAVSVCFDWVFSIVYFGLPEAVQQFQQETDANAPLIF